MNVRSHVLSIGALARAAGMTAPTIRYYADIGLLPKPSRSESGQRMYDETDVERLTFIRRCREFGFSIERVKILAGLAISPDRDCSEARDIVGAHLDDVREKLAELRALERNLKVLAQCRGDGCSGGPGRDCVVFKDLAKPDSDASR